MSLAGKRAVLLVEDLYQELEVWYPLLRLREEGAEVLIVAPQKSAVYKSKLGYPIESTLAASEVDPGGIDAVIVPGGYAPDLMRRYPDMVQVVRQAFRLGKIVAAICHGGWMLASADVLHGRKVTGFFAIKDDLVHAGAAYMDVEVAVDGNLITSRTPDDLPAFMRAIIAALA
jgi:protease I